MSRRINYAGLVVAGTGFFLTRFTVTLAIEDPLRFYLAGVVPLLLGLGLAALGVALTVADVEASLVRTTALWCVVGAGTMFVLVVLTVLGSSPDAMADLATVRSRVYLANFLIGGSVGGTLTGLYAARNRRQRGELRQQANRLAVLNRLLRHEVLNSVTVIRGYAGVDDAPELDPAAVIEEHAGHIEGTIEEVKHLTRSSAGGVEGSEALAEHLENSIEAVRRAHPDAEISLSSPPADLRVTADERLGEAFRHVLENAVVHADAAAPSVAVAVTPEPGRIRVSVADEGPGMPARQRRLLEDGEIEEFDDPGSGFGLNLVRLLVERYGGDVETAVDAEGTTVTLVLSRADAAGAALRPSRRSVTGVSPSVPHLAIVLGAALLAGVVYGLVAEGLGGSIAFIGVYYGVRDPLVGWLTHEFHSVVFGFVFAGLLSLVAPSGRDSTATYVGVGMAWGATLWVVAAGIVAPVWLRLLGFPAPVPNLSPMLLASHLAWGGSLGLLTALGYEHVVPLLDRVTGRADADGPST